MTRTVRASRRVLTSTQFLNTDSIWISDSLLSESVHRFARLQNRHGSHVPGPMEARRRANKRRNTSLAQISPGLSIDPNLVFGTGPHDAWWQTSSTAPPEPVIDSVPHFHPSWLAQSASPPMLPNNQSILQYPILKPKVEHTRTSVPELFKNLLKSIRNLDQLRDGIKGLGLNLAQDPSYSELAFNHILSSNYALAGVFLLDPWLNSPGASNYNRVILHLKENVVGKEQRKALLRAVFKGFSVGLVRREEARLILENLPDIKVDSKDGPVMARYTPKINKYYSVILKCLADCNVFSTKDLGVNVIRTWISCVNEMPCDHYAAELILSLSKSIALLQATERFEPGSRSFQVFMSHSEISTTSNLTKRWLEWLCAHPAQCDRHSGYLAQFLSQRAPALLRSIVIGIPKRLVVSIQHDKLSPQAFLIWEQVLGLFDNETVAPVLRKDSIWTKKLTESDAGLSADARLVLRLWTAIILCNRTEEPLRMLKQMDFPSQLRHQFREDDPTLLRTRIYRTLQSLPKLPFRGRLFAFLDIIQQAESSEDVVRTEKQQAVLDAFASQGFAVLQNDEAYRYALRHMNDPLKELANSINEDIPGFARIVLPLIARDKLSLRIVTRLLKHNERLHFALANSWSPPSGQGTDVANPSESLANVSRLTELATLITRSGDSNFQRAVLRFMHDLAIAFALSSALSQRQALRKVFWCFNFLHRYGAPVHSPITKALWYAGVTRCEGKDTARRVIMWLLRKVREVEGPMTAEGLVTNPDFRAKRAKEMWKWGRLLGAGLGRDEDKPRRLRGFQSDAGWACRLHPSAPREPGCEVTPRPLLRICKATPQQV